MSYPKQYIRELLCRANIREIVSIFVKLRVRGRYNQEQVGLCPFHTEETPSFVVHRNMQMWHCFGCGHHGNVLDFLMRKEEMTFQAAVSYLAKRYRLPLREWKAAKKKK